MHFVLHYKPIAQTLKENTLLAKLRAIGRSFQVEDNRAQVLGRYSSPQSRLADLTRAQQDDARAEIQSLTQLSGKAAITHCCNLSDRRSFGKDISPSRKVFLAVRGTLSEWKGLGVLRDSTECRESRPSGCRESAGCRLHGR